MQSIGNWAFYKCSSVETLYFNAIQMNDLPNKNYNLSDFGSDTTVTIGNKVKRIPDYILCPTTADRYYYTNITTISFESDSVCKEISSGSFAFLEYLTSVTLPDTLEKIGSNAFWKCSALDTITIPQNVKTIGTGAFGCADFESILVNESNAYFKSVDGHLYSKDGKTFIQYANGRYSSTFTIPDGVETIGAHAFSYSSIRKLTLPDSLKSIENMVFGYCYSLSSLTIPKNVSKIAMCTFYGSYISSVTFKATDGWHSNGTYFDSTELANATTAATYLKTTYRDYAWYRW